MAEDVIRNGSFQNPPDEIPTNSRSKRHTSKVASSTWTELKKRKSPRGDPLAGVLSNEALTEMLRRTMPASDRETEEVTCNDSRRFCRTTRCVGSTFA